MRPGTVRHEGRRLGRKLKAVGIMEQEAHAIGVDAHMYIYPLISFDVTRLYSTIIEPDKEALKGPMDAFRSAAA
jgi:hypothetical protein